MELQQLATVQSIKAPEVLSRKVNIYPPDMPIQEPTEYDLLMWQLEGMYTLPLSTMGTMNPSERYILPGFKINGELIAKLVADFKKSHGNRNVVPVQFATDSDIVVEPLRPEQFTPQPAGAVADTFRQAVAVGTAHVLPNEDQIGGGATYIEVDDDELFVITDWIEPQSTITLTALQATVDGELWRPQDMRYPMVGGDMHVYTMDFPIVAQNTLVVNAKCEWAGTSELTPVGVHICLGDMTELIT